MVREYHAVVTVNEGKSQDLNLKSCYFHVALSHGDDIHNTGLGCVPGIHIFLKLPNECNPWPELRITFP